MRDDLEVVGEQLQLGALLGGRLEIVISRDLQKIDAVAMAEQIGAKRLTIPDSNAEHRQFATHWLTLRTHHSRRHSPRRRSRLPRRSRRSRLRPGRTSPSDQTTACQPGKRLRKCLPSTGSLSG